jgi:hypothetical protein
MQVRRRASPALLSHDTIDAAHSTRSELIAPSWHVLLRLAFPIIFFYRCTTFAGTDIVSIQSRLYMSTTLLIDPIEVKEYY